MKVKVRSVRVRVRRREGVQGESEVVRAMARARRGLRSWPVLPPTGSRASLTHAKSKVFRYYTPETVTAWSSGDWSVDWVVRVRWLVLWRLLDCVGRIGVQ